MTPNPTNNDSPDGVALDKHSVPSTSHQHKWQFARWTKKTPYQMQPDEYPVNSEPLWNILEFVCPCGAVTFVEPYEVTEVRK